MNGVFTLAIIVITLFGIRCFWMAWYIHPETTDKAGQRYTNEQLVELSRTQASKNLAQYRVKMFLLGGIICFILLFCLIFLSS